MCRSRRQSYTHQKSPIVEGEMLTAVVEYISEMISMLNPNLATVPTALNGNSGACLGTENSRRSVKNVSNKFWHGDDG